MSTKEWRSLSTRELPYRTQRRIGALLDAPHSRNWKDLLAMMPEYGIVHMHQLERLPNPTMELMKHMNSTGRRLGDLYDFAQELEMKRVCELILQGLRESGHNVDDEGNELSRSRHPGDGTPPSPKPPTSPVAVAEAYHRYHHHLQGKRGMVGNGELQNGVPGNTTSSTPSPSAPSLSTHDQRVTSVPHLHLQEAISTFDDTPLSEGGCKLGQGGFGTVYYCRLPLGGTETEVAVKVFSDNVGKEIRQQFEREMQVMSRLAHPNLVPLLGYSSDGDTLCLVYPYMPLGSLDYHLANVDLVGSQRITISKDVASALHYLHSLCGDVLVHRDVKSANILLDTNWRAKLTDFGVARAVDSSSSMAVTQTIVGTRVYMAPEYCTGVVSPAADVYSYGVVLYELLCGLLAQEGPPGTSEDLLTYLLENEVSTISLPCWSQDQVQMVEKLAQLCTSNNRHVRPTMEKILQSL